jgi:hypothetical protein
MDMALDVFRAMPRFDQLPSGEVVQLMLSEAIDRELVELAVEVRTKLLSPDAMRELLSPDARPTLTTCRARLP